MKPFNRFPQDLTHIKDESGVLTRTRYTRTTYDGSVIKAYEEKDGKVSLIYEAEVPDENFRVVKPNQVKWLDPESNKQFTIMKSTGCGCKYNKLAISRTQNPEVLL